jgi:hypothetical protein
LFNQYVLCFRPIDTDPEQEDESQYDILTTIWSNLIYKTMVSTSNPEVMDLTTVDDSSTNINNDRLSTSVIDTRITTSDILIINETYTTGGVDEIGKTREYERITKSEADSTVKMDKTRGQERITKSEIVFIHETTSAEETMYKLDVTSAKDITDTLDVNTELDTTVMDVKRLTIKTMTETHNVKKTTAFISKNHETKHRRDSISTSSSIVMVDTSHQLITMYTNEVTDQTSTHIMT